MCYGATNLRLSVLRRLRCEQEGAGMRTSAVSGRGGGAGGGLRELSGVCTALQNAVASQRYAMHVRRWCGEGSEGTEKADALVHCIGIRECNLGVSSVRGYSTVYESHTLFVTRVS